ncbi:MAG: hypothetical protein Tsb0020_46880 [Haliangiales bacterium]
MVTLNAPSGEHWIDLGQGLELRVRPRSRALTARAMAEDDVDSLDPDTHPRAYGVAFAGALARVAVTGWRGVAGPDGEEIEPTPAAIDELMAIDWVFEAWARAYVAPLEAERAEKNASAPSPNGTSAGAPDIAATAPDGAGTAPTG